MDTFRTESINLSMKDASDRNFTASVYTLDGINTAEGLPRQLSIGQLVLAICLNRATEVEKKIVETMEALAQTTTQLEKLAAIDKKLQEAAAEGATSTSGYLTSEDWALLISLEIRTSLAPQDIAKLAADIEQKMDSLNSLSQETLINIQSLTSKRDDTYNLCTNMLRSFNQVIQSNVNNF